MTGAAASGIRREELGARTLLRLQRGSWSGPDVLLVEYQGGTAVVKDYSPRHPLVRRTLGRWLVRRELRAYRALESHPAVPPLLGEVDDLALAVTHRGGPRFSRRRPWTFSPRFGEALAEATRGLHERGVVHLDLRHRSNIRADMAGRPVLIDFGSALVFAPGGTGARWLLPALALVDRYAVWKWRRRMAATARVSPAPPRPTAAAARADPRSGERSRA